MHEDAKTFSQYTHFVAFAPFFRYVGIEILCRNSHFVRAGTPDSRGNEAKSGHQLSEKRRSGCQPKADPACGGNWRAPSISEFGGKEWLVLTFFGVSV